MLIYHTLYPAFDTKGANIFYFIFCTGVLALDIQLIFANGRDFVDIPTLEQTQRQYDVDELEMQTFDKSV